MIDDVSARLDARRHNIVRQIPCFAPRNNANRMERELTPEALGRGRAVIATCAVACLAAPAFAAEPSAAQPVEAVFTGDTSFGESYQDRLASQGREPVLRTRGYDYMIDAIAPLLGGAALTIVNLETPLTDHFPSPF